MNASELPPFWALIPAAGIGSRMRADRPKQYLQLAGKSIIEHTLACFLDHPQLLGVVVSLAADDPYWPSLTCAGEPRIYRASGGRERADSVLAGLRRLGELGAQAHDWVLVHDAARPCLRAADIDRLIAEVGDSETGGLLAVPVADTLKRGNAGGEVLQTEAREHLWRAQTPQMFRYRVLIEALRRADIAAVTDESSAVEQTGVKPKLVPGSASNFKVTYAEDLALAELILKANR